MEQELIYGKTIGIDIIYPKYVLFADETRLNTSSKDNSHEANTMLICKAGHVLKTESTTSNHQCNILPFTSASGNTVMCAVIFHGKLPKLPIDLQVGVNP